MALAGWLWIGAAFVVGLLFGSFLNVCIARLPYHESIVKPGSHCPGCMFPILWYDNIPILSFLILRGRCRKCFQRISSRYLIVELSVALWFAVATVRALPTYLCAPPGTRIYHSYPAQPLAGVETAVLGWLLFGLAFTDWETHLLPDALTLPGIGLGFFFACTEAIFLPAGFGDIHLHKSMRMSSPGSMVERGDVFLTGPEALVFGRIAAIIGAAGILWLIGAAYKAVRGQDGLGMGDVKLMGLIAAFLGFWPAMLAMFVGVVSCALYACILLATRRAHALTRLPLGSFLAFGGLVSALAGPRIVAWYAGLL